jgi:hypothetical protein
MRKAATYFEQIPVQKVKNMIVALRENKSVHTKQTLHSTRSILHCRICSKPIPVESAKTDGEGQAIHEECYILSLTQKSASSRIRRTQLSN